MDAAFGAAAAEEFVKGVVAGTVAPYIKSEEVPAPAKEGEVQTIVAKNFKEASLLAGTFLLGLSAVEAMLYFMGG